MNEAPSNHASPPPTASPDTLLRERLRSQTAAAHQALEDGLDLLGPVALGPQGQARIRGVLGGFHGFHAVWEPAFAACLDEPELSQPRARLAALRSDLLALGATHAEVDALPRCAAAASLVSAPAQALGSLYVMEGSTLGGKLISRTLAGAGWWPSGGLRYFDPHGEHTGPRWRETLARLARTTSSDHDAVVAGALATFALLQDWLVLLQPRAAGSGNIAAS